MNRRKFIASMLAAGASLALPLSFYDSFKDNIKITTEGDYIKYFFLKDTNIDQWTPLEGVRISNCYFENQTFIMIKKDVKKFFMDNCRFTNASSLSYDGSYIKEVRQI